MPLNRRKYKLKSKVRCFSQVEGDPSGSSSLTVTPVSVPGLFCPLPLKTTKKYLSKILIFLLPVYVSTVSPKIVEISSDISINEGNNISLTCIATGRPEPTVTWRHISPKGKRSGRTSCHARKWENGLAVAGGYGAGGLVTRIPHSWWPDNSILVAPQRISILNARRA